MMIQELEITAASEKLAECQETILNLGKQLKALTNSKETDNLTQMETKPEKRLTTQRSSLLDQMKAEDEDNGEESKKEEKKPQAADKMGKGGSSSVYSETIEALEHILLSDKKSKGSESNCFAVVPQKKSSGGGKSLWRKLLGRKREVRPSSFLIHLPPKKMGVTCNTIICHLNPFDHMFLFMFLVL